MTKSLRCYKCGHLNQDTEADPAEKIFSCERCGAANIRIATADGTVCGDPYLEPDAPRQVSAEIGNNAVSVFPEQPEREPWMNWNPRFRDPDEETMEKLRRSGEAYAKAKKRQIRCPVCHARLIGVHAERTGFVEVKCQNCKFTGALDLRLFRALPDRKTGRKAAGQYGWDPAVRTGREGRDMSAKTILIPAR